MENPEWYMKPVYAVWNTLLDWIFQLVLALPYFKNGAYILAWCHRNIKYCDWWEGPETK